MLIRMKTNYAHPTVLICANVRFFVLIRTGVRITCIHTSPGVLTTFLMSLRNSSAIPAIHKAITTSVLGVRNFHVRYDNNTTHTMVSKSLRPGLGYKPVPHGTLFTHFYVKSNTG
jgi:hypothetical protein